MLRRPARLLLLSVLALAGLSAGLFALTVQTTPAGAAPPLQETTPPPAMEAAPEATRVPNMSLSDEYCLGCHGAPGQSMPLANGDALDLYVEPAMHQNSVHGESGIACAQCHTEVGEYPHPPFEAIDRREVTLKLQQVCQRCHAHQFELAQDDVHAVYQATGIRQAAVCTDCHTAHEVRQLRDPENYQLLADARQWIPERCGLCHSTIYEKYRSSVHGAALTEGNRDVPTCVDCHGVHNIEDPTTSYFRLNSPQICAKCHTDPQIMNKYGISTNVLDTYVADFHGTTVAIFEKQSPDAEVNKAVCYDCHGVHDIASPDDPQAGLQMKQNLLARCQTCHPDANANFSSAWMSHYEASPEKYPGVYYVNLFYAFFIPAVLGGMGLLVVMSVSRDALNRRKRLRGGGAQVFAAPAETPPPVDAGEAPPAEPQTPPSDSTDSEAHNG